MTKSLIFLLLLSPFLYLLFQIYNGDLIDPVEEITNPTGQWAIRFLILAFAITPIVRITKFYKLIKFRRMIGVFAFFYMLLHFSIWLIDQSFDLELIIEDIKKRTYILVGFIAFIASLLLAITSTNNWIKRLKKNWKRLHRLIYIIVPLAWLHFFLQAKSDMQLQPHIYGVIILIFSAIRIYFLLKK
jgi:sulfoxide reductase heme-binding subunit YedZ